MKTPRWIGPLAALILIFLLATNPAWSAEPAAAAQPNGSVGTDAAAPPKDVQPGTATGKSDTAPKSAKPASKPTGDDKDFKPSEEISEDTSVAYPTDI